MACEKQFVPHHENTIYCSEECRLYDQESSSSNTTPMCSSRQSYSSSSHTASAQYSFYGTSQTEPRDIIPRASPSRPQSHFSPPTPPSSHDQTSDAIKALRSLSIRPPSPPTPSSTYHSSIWPFSKSTTASPASSYTRPLSGLFSSTYDGGYYGAAGYGVTSPSTDRPLPSRRPGSHARPKSIELVMPMIGGQ
ncbi:hypothetical protein DL546_000989 [Coniochaeta pulveracea]|uniref:Life-span regulatory factor domain-containing protein n=1 Tax=Coniochaeta pulveracea TaxID=177199 RepID=A0A420XXB9_9PEZI|nr:hypothetical protein DL546_000989 [Coniochaeta pulveracea]